MLAAALLLGGCGHTASSHAHFVGTWHVVGFQSGSGIAISRASSTVYRVTTVAQFKPVAGASWWFFQHGSDELRAMLNVKIEDPLHPSNSTRWLELIKFDPASGRLTWTVNGMYPEVFTKVSDSTALPSPWPSASP